MSEASEIEHMLMVEYLFAALSLKTDASEGLTEEQLEAVKRWEGLILEVATQEMLHLALWGNLLTAIGGAPHFDRPNFPQPLKYYPPGFQLALLPFSEQSLGNFVFNERPEGMESDPPALELARAARLYRAARSPGYPALLLVARARPGHRPRLGAGGHRHDRRAGRGGSRRQ